MENIFQFSVSCTAWVFWKQLSFDKHSADSLFGFLGVQSRKKTLYIHFSVCLTEIVFMLYLFKTSAYCVSQSYLDYCTTYTLASASQVTRGSGCILYPAQGFKLAPMSNPFHQVLTLIYYGNISVFTFAFI